MKTLYLLAGYNGAGKTTTAAYALLPGLLGCRVIFCFPSFKPMVRKLGKLPRP